MTLVSHSVQKSNPYETVHECETAPSSSEQFSPGCPWGLNSLTPNSHTKQTRSQYILTDLHINIDQSQAHIRPRAHSLLMTSRRAILGNHSYRFSTSPILTPFHLYHWPDLLQLSHITDAVLSSQPLQDPHGPDSVTTKTEAVHFSKIPKNLSTT
jgi:hypothetical protein